MRKKKGSVTPMLCTLGSIFYKPGNPCWILSFLWIHNLINKVLKSSFETACNYTLLTKFIYFSSCKTKSTFTTMSMSGNQHYRGFTFSSYWKMKWRLKIKIIWNATRMPSSEGKLNYLISKANNNYFLRVNTVIHLHSLI